MAKLISKTYGEALFDLAMEEHSVEQLAEEAVVVLDVVASNPDFAKLLCTKRKKGGSPHLLLKPFRQT